MTPEPTLNKTEVWIAEHSIRILLTLGVLIVVGGFFVAKAVVEAGETSRKVTRIEPQVTRVNKAICDKQSLHHPQRAQRCAERIRVGLINCRRSEPCRAALLAAITYPPPARGATGRSNSAPKTSPDGGAGGGETQHPHPAGQHPSPGSQPGPEASPAPSPSPGPSGDAEGGPPAETPGNGPQNGAGGSSSGAGVEVCAVKTCVGVEVGADQSKGANP